MSYTEYKDMFLDCQDTAPYHLFIFDIANSRNIKDYSRNSNISKLIFQLYKKIEQIEKQQNITILHRSPLLIETTLQKEENNYHLEPIKKEPIRQADLFEPFLTLGDTIGLTILRDSLDINTVYTLFDQTKEELGINYDFHYANGFYETDDYIEGNEKLFRGYAIQILATMHKDKKEKVIKKEKNEK